MRPGLVSLVGAGPGDPGLLTLRGRRALERADVVLYDHLASPALLASVHVPGQERIHVGKTAGPGRTKQADIEELLVRRALAGARVVRLKGGDPMVFGRGGEEASACARAGVPFEVIPGVSALSAVPASAGIPLTHRDSASAFVCATGHERDDDGDDEPKVDWERLARAGGTIVVFMGVLQAERWIDGLRRGGLSPETPAAAIRWGTTPRQETLVATLGTFASRLREIGFRPPAVAVVGEVVRYRESLSWFETRPLMGQVIGVTRSKRGDLEAFEALEDLGAQIVHLPLTEQRPVAGGAALREALLRGGHTDLVVTSANGVQGLARALEAAGKDARHLAGLACWSVGPGTAKALRKELCLTADHVPADASGESLVALARDVGVAGRRFLFPAAAGARRVVPEGLRALGAEVEEIASYETVPDPLAPARLESALERGLSLVTVASPSAVDALVDALATLGVPPDRVPVAAIGPTTADHARSRGVPVSLTAADHTMAGLARAILDPLPFEKDA